MSPQWQVNKNKNKTKTKKRRRTTVILPKVQVTGYNQTRIHLKPHDVGFWLTALSRHSVGSYQGNELSRNSSRNAHPQSSQVAEPLWTDLWPEESSWCARADLHFFFFFFKRRREMIRRSVPLNSRIQGKTHHHRLYYCRR